MSELKFHSYSEANAFALLMKKVAGQEVAVSQQGSQWIVTRNAAYKTIVEFTEDLLRHVGK
jgi:hypothetical protein